jgi:hypothetical protein
VKTRSLLYLTNVYPNNKKNKIQIGGNMMQVKIGGSRQTRLGVDRQCTNSSKRLSQIIIHIDCHSN